MLKINVGLAPLTNFNLLIVSQLILLVIKSGSNIKSGSDMYLHVLNLLAEYCLNINLVLFVFFNFFLFRLQGSIQPESLKMLLDYTLARGNLKSIFKVLKLLYGKCDFLSFLMIKLFLDYFFVILCLFIFYLLLYFY